MLSIVEKNFSNKTYLKKGFFYQMITVKVSDKTLESSLY